MNEKRYDAIVSSLFFEPDCNPKINKPKKFKVTLYFDDGIENDVLLDSDNISINKILKDIPQLQCADNCKQVAKDILTQFYSLTLCEPEIDSYYLDKQGLTRLSNGKLCYIIGNQVIGNCDKDYLIEPQLDLCIRSLDIENPLFNLCTELCNVKSKVLLGVAFLIATLIRSWIMQHTDSWQAVLAITGKQGMGKTTLASRLTDWIVANNNRPLLQFSAGSTPSAIRDMLVSACDLPVVIDDLCLSSSSTLQRKYKDLGGCFLREGSNATGIIKKQPDGKTLNMSCNAGVILTAEFPMDNPSDITRSIYLCINKPLDLPDSFSSELIGCACVEFLKWFIENEQISLSILSDTLSDEYLKNKVHPRVKNNFSILYTAFQLLLLASTENGLSEEHCNLLKRNFEKAAFRSINYQCKLLKKIDMKTHGVNLAKVILMCCKKNAFNLCKNGSNIDMYDGIIKNDELYIRPIALSRTIQLQDGCSNYTLNSIIKQLINYGALFIHENGTYQCKYKNIRVYHISLKALKKHTKK